MEVLIAPPLAKTIERINMRKEELLFCLGIRQELNFVFDYPNN